MAKNICVFSDGTGQEGGKGHNSNVYRLFNMVEDRTPHQVAFYDRGLGTGWRKITGLAAGAGISQNIRECYRFIFDEYQAGDRVYLFGFSRGAFTVRSLSGFINLFGILPASRPELIKDAYKIYKISKDDKRKSEAAKFLKHHHRMSCPIEFIGVWDTVGALGLPIKTLDLLNPFRHEFHDTTMSENVAHGVHALSIDDERLTFHPTLWDEHKKLPEQTVEQVWFAGAHTDVGGGYADCGLSDITLEWMVERAQSHGLRIYPNHRVVTNPDPNGKIHDSRSGVASLYRRAERQADAGKLVGPPKIHVSVTERSHYNPWILKGPTTVVHTVTAQPQAEPPQPFDSANA